RPAVRRRRGAPDAARAPGVPAPGRRARRQAGRRRRARRRHREGRPAGAGPRRRSRGDRHQPPGRAAPRRGGPGRPGREAREESIVSEAPNVDEELLARIEHQVLWLTINRPDAGNAITPAVRNRMIDHLTDANTNYDVRAIVLTAA